MLDDDVSDDGEEGNVPGNILGQMGEIEEGLDGLSLGQISVDAFSDVAPPSRHVRRPLPGDTGSSNPNGRPKRSTNTIRRYPA